MRFMPPLQFGQLIKRYKRFLADVRLDDGSVVTAHCTNTGSMKTCSQPGWRVGLSTSDNPKRKHATTWELVHNGSGWIGINTLLANRLAEEAIRAEKIAELVGYDTIRTEQRYGTNSRIDLLLERDGRLYPIEVKLTTKPTKGDARGISVLRESYFRLDIAPGLVICPTTQLQRLNRTDYALPWDSL